MDIGAPLPDFINVQDRARELSCLSRSAAIDLHANFDGLSDIVTIHRQPVALGQMKFETRAAIYGRGRADRDEFLYALVHRKPPVVMSCS
jgi:hypothetical protein